MIAKPSHPLRGRLTVAMVGSYNRGPFRLSRNPARVEPVEIIVNDRSRRVGDGISVAQLVDELGLADKHVAVEVNLQLVPRTQHAEHRLAEGDRLEIVTLVGGG